MVHLLSPGSHRDQSCLPTQTMSSTYCYVQLRPGVTSRRPGVTSRLSGELRSSSHASGMDRKQSTHTSGSALLHRVMSSGLPSGSAGICAVGRQGPGLLNVQSLSLQPSRKSCLVNVGGKGGEEEVLRTECLQAPSPHVMVSGGGVFGRELDIRL